VSEDGSFGTLARTYVIDPLTVPTLQVGKLKLREVSRTCPNQREKNDDSEHKQRGKKKCQSKDRTEFN
jgi:hypothetical protein